MGFDALRLCIVSASAVLWLIVDPRWGAGARWAFPPAPGKEKPRLAFMVSAVLICSLAGSFGGQREKSHAYDWMKGAPVTDPSYALQFRSAAFRAGRDAPSLTPRSSVSRHRRWLSKKPYRAVRIAAWSARSSGGSPARRMSVSISLRTTRLSHTASLFSVVRGGGACGGPPQNKTALLR